MIHRPFERRKHGTNGRRHGTTGRRRHGTVGGLGGSMGGVSKSMGSLSGRPSRTDYSMSRRTILANQAASTQLGLPNRQQQGTMELENSQNNALAKLPMLKLGEYKMWEIKIKQYFYIQDYALWEVIENGNSWVPILVTAPESGPSTTLKMTVPSTSEEKICKKND
ncbi:hypothetical protein Tco_1429901, partial [Tanacetum coccineum]